MASTDTVNALMGMNKEQKMKYYSDKFAAMKANKSLGSDTSSQSTDLQGATELTPAGQIQQAMDEANAANEQRYQQGLGELYGGQSRMQNLYGQAYGVLGNLGQTAMEDINQSYKRATASGLQDLIGRGLGSTTITMGMERAAQEDRSRQVGALYESLASQQSGLLERQAASEATASQPIANFIAAREDYGPDTALYADLLKEGAEGTGTGDVSTAMDASNGGTGTVNIPGVNIPGYTNTTGTEEAAFNPADTAGAWTPQNQVRKRQQIKDITKQIKELRSSSEGKGMSEQELELTLQKRELVKQAEAYQAEQNRTRNENRYTTERYKKPTGTMGSGGLASKYHAMGLLSPV